MKIKVSQATNLQIDWAVAHCQNLQLQTEQYVVGVAGEDGTYYQPSTDWAQGGPIIEQEKIGILFYVDHIPDDADEPIWVASCGGERALGDTPLIAAMRCYVILELDNEIDIPEELK